MSYRSIKRVLGETNLERKCRLLFGACLALLIFGSFGWVLINSEQLVYEKDVSTGRRLVDSIMLKYHWEQWETRTDEQGKVWRDLVKQLSDDLQNLKYDYKFLALDENGVTSTQVQLPEGPWERDILVSLRKKLEEQAAAAAVQKQKADADSKSGQPQGLTSLFSPGEIIPVYEQRARAETPGEYHYYQPVYWKERCSACHSGLVGIGVVPAADTGTYFGDGAPFRVVKVIIPDSETQLALNANRAILIATAITTVFVAMVALYLIFKYVVVRPLKHLRNVSDNISRGETSLRADIHTGDEFEELGDSFNRMLRHLTDAQTELRQLNSDLDAKVDLLARANMQLYEMNRIKSDFLANMSHELRTPLNSIIGFSEVLRGIGSLDEKQKRYAENIQKSGRVLLDMINDILDLAKLESGKMEVRPSEFDVGRIVSAQCDMVRSLTEEKNIDLEVRVQAGLPPMFQDQGKVQQILTNLLSNAIKFTPEGGRITVDVIRSDVGDLELTVTDTGVGIAEEDRDVIFEKFRQGTVVAGGDNLTREYSGTGLGLSIVMELCKLLGGEVTFQSELGMGSAFTIRLPWIRPDQPRRDAALAAKLDDLSRSRRTDALSDSAADEHASVAASSSAPAS